MNILRRNDSIFDNLVCLDDRDFGVLAHRFVEVVLRFAELAVPQPICARDFDKGVVAEDGLFHDVGFSVEFAGFFGGRHDGDGAVGVVADGEFAGLDCMGC